MSVEPAVHCGSRGRTHREVRARAAGVASGLHGLGVSSGDRVALVLRNDIEFVEVSLGIGLIGAVPVPVNWHWKGKELAYLLGDSAAKVVFAHSDLAPDVEAVLPAGVELIQVVPSPDLAVANKISEVAATPIAGHREFEPWLAEQTPWTQPPTSVPMGVIYTSGTTGNPKGILRERITPECNQRLAALLMDFWKLAPGLRTLLPTPAYHSAPNTHAMMSIALGCDLTFMPKFSAEELLRIIDEHRIQHLQLAPTILVKLLALPEEIRARYDVSSLEAVVHGAAPCPVDVKKAMIDWWGPVFIECYGGSEAGIVTAGRTEDWLTHPGTVGSAVGGAELKILAPDTRQPLPAGEVGEVFLKCPDAWPDFTYIGDPAKRAAMEHEGYWTLGDLGYLDADGFLYLTDRTSDMVIFGGTNIYPAEIEECLLGLKGVNDVAVFGIPDAEFGEVLATHIDVDPAAGLTEDDVRQHVATNLAKYKVPRVVVFDNDLPREETGKLFKRRIRQRYLDAAATKAPADVSPAPTARHNRADRRPREDLIFTEEHQALRQTIRAFLTKEFVPHIEEWERTTFPDSVFERMANAGLLGLDMPEKYGGQGGDYYSAVVLAEELWRCCAVGTATGIGVNVSLVMPVINALGTEEQKQRYLMPAIAGRHIFCLGITEPDGGSDVAAIRTRAVLDDSTGEYVINGSKMFISNGIRAHTILLLTRTSPEDGRGTDHRGFTLFLVDMNLPGVIRERKLDKMGMNSSDTGLLAFQDVRVPASAAVGEIGAGFVHIMAELQAERLVMAAGGVAAAQAMFDRTLRYAGERTAFGRPIGHFQAIRHKFAQMATDLEAARSHRGMAARLSAYAGCSVWLPHYRLAPEHPFPAAFDDAVTAYRWLLAHGHATPRTLVVAGDSAGGQLATAVIGALGTAAQPAAAGLLLFSPWLELDVAKLDASIRDPVLPTSYGYACRNAYLGAGDPTDPRLNVLTGDVAAFPPVLLQVGGTEILTGCANQFTATLQAAGVPVELQVWPGQIHVWPAFTPLVPEGKRALQIAARFITDRTSQT